METRSNHVLVGAVVLILLAVLALFTVWLSQLNNTDEAEYDIFFKQAVDGLAKGSQVSFSGVPVGQVKQIALYKEDPQFVRVRISISPDTPILQGTTASIQSSFTGPSNVQLDGAVKGAPAIACPQQNPKSSCPLGVPVIPTKPGGIGAIFSSAPQLLDRLSTLTERLTALLSDKNQASIAGILENTNRLTRDLSDRGPEIAATLAETRITVQKFGVAAQQIGDLAQSTNGVVQTDVRPAMANLNQAIASAKRSMDTLDATLNDARPGVQSLSQRTIPEIGQLVGDLRTMSMSLSSISERLDRGGATGLIGSQRLPEYKPGKGAK